MAKVYFVVVKGQRGRTQGAAAQALHQLLHDDHLTLTRLRAAWREQLTLDLASGDVDAAGIALV